SGGGRCTVSWPGVAGATSYRVHVGTAPGQEHTSVETGLLPLPISAVPAGVDTPKFTTNVVASATTGDLAWNASAADVQTALDNLIKTALNLPALGNVVVARNDDVYVIRFQGALSDTAQRLLKTNLSATDPLVKTSEQLGGGLISVPGTATVSIRATGYANPADALNQVQVLTIDATAGTFKLSFNALGPNGLNVAVTTRPLPYNIGA